jgi:hypothetical protein
MTDSSRFDTFLQVRLTTHDKERIKARAKANGENTSAYVRRRALVPLDAHPLRFQIGPERFSDQGFPKTAQAPRSDP